jgi:hypothetical protein
LADRRVAIAMAIEKVAPGDVLGQWLELLRRTYWPGPIFKLRPAYIVQARNGLTKQALLRGDWDDLLWVDSDILPDTGLPSRIAELVERPDYNAPAGGVVCGAYYGREYPFEVQLYNQHPELEGLQFIHPSRWLPALAHSKRCYEAHQSAPLLPCGGGGTGLMLIRRDVLERMAEMKGPGSIWETPALEPALAERVRAGGDERDHWTEDVWFCVEVNKRLGVQVMADTDFRFSGAHENYDRIGPQHYIASHTMPPGYEDRPLKLPQGYQVIQPNRAARRRAAAR